MVKVAELASTYRGLRCVIVGGQGGVGSAVADQLCSLGARVVSASRRGENDWIAPAQGELVMARLDLTDPDSIAAFTVRTGQALGAIELLVCSGGVSRQAGLEALDDATIDAVFSSNAMGPLRLIRDCSGLLRAGTDPVVVNVSSVAARTGQGSNIAYCGAKAAMDAMMTGLAKQLAPAVRTVSVAPSALETPFAQGRGADFIERTIGMTPLGRLASLEEVATAILLAARGLSFTTGVPIFVDGGRHL
jgi:3-oxoacyl-[acyl-carrier protein] reductase